MQNSKLVSVIVFLLFGLTVMFSFASSIFYVIESTERAVIFYKFGKGLDKENVVKPGFGIIFFLCTLLIISINFIPKTTMLFNVNL